MKDILMIGTSNFSRISWVSRDDAQICAIQASNFIPYSNSTFSNTALAPLILVENPRKVVISCGLNDKTLAPSTADISLCKIINEAQRIFPGSEIYLAQIAISSKLPTSEQNDLKILNDKI